ncbi:MAG: pilus assembly protein TadG-related protein [Bryobacteraceae bacterium]
MRRDPTERRGAILIVVCLGLFLLAAGAGLALDVSRMLLVQKELRSRVDAAALAAALELDGASDSVARARAEAAAVVDAERIEFAALDQAAEEPAWSDTPADAARVGMVRVTSVVGVPLTLVRTVVREKTASVRVRSTARASVESRPVELVR